MEEKGLGSEGMDEGRIRALIEGLIEEWPDVPPEDRLKLAEKFPEAFALSGLTMEEPPYVERPLADEEEDEEDLLGDYMEELKLASESSPEAFAKQESDILYEVYLTTLSTGAKKEEERQMYNRYLASIGGTPIEANPSETKEEMWARRREELISGMTRLLQRKWPRCSLKLRVKFSGKYAEEFARSGLSLDDPYEER